MQSGVAASGAYVVEFHVGDRAWVRTPDEAIRHALAVIRQAEIADHDAAVLRQLVSIGVDLEAAVLTVSRDLRPDRPPIDAADLAPLGLGIGMAQEGVAARPFLVLLLDDEPLGQWTVTDAREHALAVLQMITVVDMDAAYKRMLISAIGLEPWRAAAVVGDLGKHRWEDPK